MTMTTGGPIPSEATDDRGVAVIVGGSRGLGLLIARELGRLGYRVVVLARDLSDLDVAVAMLRSQGVDAHRLVLDVADADRFAEVILEIEQRHGPVHVAMHVAGIIEVGPLDAMTRDHFREALDVMLWGPINLTFAVLPHMRARGAGRIGVVTSIGGKVSVSHLLPYSTAKFGAAGFTQGLHAELAGTGITCTTIVPGLMRTGSHLHARFSGDQAKEYAWFAPLASLPLISMNAERAAKQMVRATLAGQPVALISIASKIACRVAGLAPSTTVRMLGLTGRSLPTDTGDGRTVTGATARRRLSSKLVDVLTVLGDRAARRNNEIRS